VQRPTRHGAAQQGDRSRQNELARDRLILGTAAAASSTVVAGNFLDVFAKNAADSHRQRNSRHEWAVNERRYLRPQYAAFASIENAFGSGAGSIVERSGQPASLYGTHVAHPLRKPALIQILRRSSLG
jgi:hypothetical protein